MLSLVKLFSIFDAVKAQPDLSICINSYDEQIVHKVPPINQTITGAKAK